MAKVSFMTNVLGGAGLIPFVVFGIAYWANLAPWGFSPLPVFIGYSAIILSFLAGTLWGQSLVIDEVNTSFILILSNIIAIGAWCCIFLSSQLLALVVLISGYLLVLWLEQAHRVISLNSYWALRCCLTVVVICLHGAVLCKMLFYLD